MCAGPGGGRGRRVRRREMAAARRPDRRPPCRGPEGRDRPRRRHPDRTAPALPGRRPPRRRAPPPHRHRIPALSSVPAERASARAAARCGSPRRTAARRETVRGGPSGTTAGEPTVRPRLPAAVRPERSSAAGSCRPYRLGRGRRHAMAGRTTEARSASPVAMEPVRPVERRGPLRAGRGGRLAAHWPRAAGAVLHPLRDRRRALQAPAPDVAARYGSTTARPDAARPVEPAFGPPAWAAATLEQLGRGSRQKTPASRSGVLIRDHGTGRARANWRPPGPPCSCPRRPDRTAICR